MLYNVIKHIHIGCVTLSFALFVIRSLLHYSDSPYLKKPLLKITPHIIDTTLLITGITLLHLLGYWHALPPWLMIKFITLLMYIMCGIICFRIRSSHKLTFPAALGFFFTTAYLAINKPDIW